MSKKILIVDDDQDLLIAYRSILETKGHDVTTCSTSNAGLKAFNDNKPDIVFLDMIVDKANAGIEMCEKIRETDKNVKIYLLSDVGEATTSNLNIHDLGFNGALQKPVKPNELLTLVAK